MTDIKNLKHVHFTGIKGVGMTSLALCVKDLGIKVSGSDVEEIFVTDETLKKHQIDWTVGFSEKNLEPKPDLVITTGAHGGFNNPEVAAAKNLGIPIMSHAGALAKIAGGKEIIAVCGVGGKTSTCSMVATILDRVGAHPSFAIGVGNIPALGTPGRWDPKGNVFICEADEFAISPGIDNRPRFSLLKPTVLIVTNIEHDHPDIYPTLENTKKTFRNFFENLNQNNLLVANSDNINILEICRNLKTKVVIGYYGFNKENAIWHISQMDFGKGQTKFHLLMDGLQNHSILLSVPGKLNVYNATAAFLAAREVCRGMDNQLIKALEEYTGCKRRFEKVLKKNGIVVYDDYAHHPLEIASTLKAAREWFPKRRIIAVFQPHTYSRTKTLFNEFAQSFKDADIVALMDIYASARETDNLGMNSALLADLTKKYHSNVNYTKGHKDTIEFLANTVKSGDVILTLGAGNIFHIHNKLSQTLDKINE